MSVATFPGTTMTSNAGSIQFHGAMNGDEDDDCLVDQSTRHYDGLQRAIGDRLDDFTLRAVPDRSRFQACPLQATRFAKRYALATADDASQFAQPVRELLRNLRILLDMDIVFVAELKDNRKTFRFIDYRGVTRLGTKEGDSFPSELTLCQKVVEGKAPQLMNDVEVDPVLSDLEAVKLLKISAYLSSPVVLRDGTVYGTVCCISRKLRSALGSRQLDSLQHVAKLVAAEIDRGDLHATWTRTHR